MRIAFFDCFAGVSGNMILGALIDAGLKKETLFSELKRLKISGYKINVKKIMKKDICATSVNVGVKEQVLERKLKDITQLINKSNLDSEVKRLSKSTFNQLATVEGKVHGKGKEQVHLHEVGAVDAIVDVVGSFIGIKKLGVELVYSSKLHVGTGFLNCRQGVLPVPAPATVQILKGVPIYSTGLENELVTPTGACILKNCTRNFGVMPQMRVHKIGYGAGSRELPIPNLLRLYIGEIDLSQVYDRDEAILLEANVDDLTPEILAYVCERLRSQGALDVYTTPIYMKKNRIGSLLSALVREDKLEQAIATIFTETTTLGVRVSRLQRYRLCRKIISVKTRFGKMKVKIAKLGEKIKSVSPEFESCKQASIKQAVPLKDVYDEAKKAADQALSNDRESSEKV